MFIDVIRSTYQYHVNPYQDNVQIIEKTGGWLSWQIVSKNIRSYRPVFFLKISLFLRYSLTHLASKKTLSFLQKWKKTWKWLKY